MAHSSLSALFKDSIGTQELSPNTSTLCPQFLIVIEWGKGLSASSLFGNQVIGSIDSKILSRNSAPGVPQAGQEALKLSYL